MRSSGRLGRKLGNGKEDRVTVQRYKGLGEMNSDQLWDTTMNPDTRTLKQVTIESAAEANRIFSMLMGDEVAPRRDFFESTPNMRNWMYRPPGGSKTFCAECGQNR